MIRITNSGISYQRRDIYSTCRYSGKTPPQPELKIEQNELTQDTNSTRTFD
jgi:hypothetical protein